MISQRVLHKTQACTSNVKVTVRGKKEYCLIELYRSEESSIDSSMLYPLLLMIAAFYAVFACTLLLQMRVEILKREAGSSWVNKIAAARSGVV